MHPTDPILVTTAPEAVISGLQQTTENLHGGICVTCYSLYHQISIKSLLCDPEIPLDLALSSEDKQANKNLLSNLAQETLMVRRFSWSPHPCFPGRISDPSPKLKELSFLCRRCLSTPTPRSGWKWDERKDTLKFRRVSKLSVKGQIVSILGFESHMTLIVTTQLWHYSLKATTDRT